MATYNFTLRNIVEENEVTEHGDEAEESQARHYVDHCVLKIKLSWNIECKLKLKLSCRTCPALYDDDELDAIGLIEGPPPLLVEVGVPEVPTHGVKETEMVPGYKASYVLVHEASHCTLKWYFLFLEMSAPIRESFYMWFKCT